MAGHRGRLQEPQAHPRQPHRPKDLRGQLRAIPERGPIAPRRAQCSPDREGADGEGSDPPAGQPKARQETRGGSQALGRNAEVTVGVLPGTEEISGIRRRRTPATPGVPGPREGLPEDPGR